jgi:hypothetical protein
VSLTFDILMLTLGGRWQFKGTVDECGDDGELRSFGDEYAVEVGEVVPRDVW